MRTTDGGITWSDPNITGYAEVLNSVCFSDANTGYAVGDYGTILKSTDGGASWNIQPSMTYKNLYSVYFPGANTGYAVGANGTILKNTDGGIPVRIDEKQQTTGLKIYPNPATDKITLELPEAGSAMNGIVSVYGITGQQLIQQQVQGITTIIDINSLPTGIYFARLVNREKNAHTAVSIGKFVKN